MKWSKIRKMFHAWLINRWSTKVGFVWSFLFIPPFCCFLSLYPFPFVCSFSLLLFSFPFLSLVSFPLYTRLSLASQQFVVTAGPKFCAELTFWAEVDVGSHTVRLPMASCLLQWSRYAEEFQCRILCSLVDSPSCSSSIFFFPEKEARQNHIWYHGLRGRVGMHSSDFDVGNFLLASWPGRSIGLGIRTWVQSRFCHERSVSPWAGHLVSSSIKQGDLSDPFQFWHSKTVSPLPPTYLLLYSWAEPAGRAPALGPVGKQQKAEQRMWEPQTEEK